MSIPTLPSHRATSLPATTDEKKTYLSRSIETISLEHETSLRRTSKLWKAAAIASGIALLILSCGTLAAVSFFSSGSTLLYSSPIIMMTTFPLMSRIVGKFLSHSNEALSLAEQAKEIRFLLDSFPTTKEGMKQELQNLGIPLEGLPEDLTMVRPLLAHHLYWKKQTKSLTEASQELSRETCRISLLKDPKEIENLPKMREEVLSLEQTAMIAKTRAAFFYGILKKPLYEHSFSEVIQFRLTPFAERQLEKRFCSPDANVFVEFLQSKARPIEMHEVATNSSIPRLAERLMAGIPA